MIDTVTQELTQTWGKLQTLMPVTVIRNEHQYKRALEALHNLLDIVEDDEKHPLYELLDRLGTVIYIGLTQFA